MQLMVSVDIERCQQAKINEVFIAQGNLLKAIEARDEEAILDLMIWLEDKVSPARMQLFEKAMMLGL